MRGSKLIGRCFRTQDVEDRTDSESEEAEQPRRQPVIQMIQESCCLPLRIPAPTASSRADAATHPPAQQEALPLIWDRHVPTRKVVEFQYELYADIDKILAAPYYFGNLDKHEAERLLEDRVQGSFLLRDSSQPDFMFSVSFRRYGRTMHARLEQEGHRFGFDIHEPSTFSASSVMELIEHFRDPARKINESPRVLVFPYCLSPLHRCTFLDPILTIPIHRTFPFSLQELAAAKVASNLKYKDIHSLGLPFHLGKMVSSYNYVTRVTPASSS